MKFSVIGFVAVSTSFSAFASGWTQEVAEHKAIQGVISALGKLGTTCRTPVESDVKSFCTGALPEVTKPTIVPTGCMFMLNVDCGNSELKVSGSNTSYIVIGPRGSTPVEGSTSDIIISNVEFGSKN